VPFTTAAIPWWSNAVIRNDTGGSLGAEGAVYLVSQDTAATYTIDADHIAVLVRPGVALTGTANSFAPVVSAASRRFLWFEGAVAPGPSDAEYLVSLRGVAFSVVRNVQVSSAWGAGVWLQASSNNWVSRVAAADTYGVALSNSSHNTIEQVTSTGGVAMWLADSSNNDIADVVALDGYFGVALSNSTANDLTAITVTWNSDRAIYVIDSSRNRITDVTAADNLGGVLVIGSTQNSIANVTVSNSGAEAGVMLQEGSNHNALSGITAVNNAAEGLSVSASSNNVFYDLTVANNGGAGIVLSEASNNVLAQAVAANNGSFGVALEFRSSGNTISNLASAHNGDYGVVIGQFTSANRFTGWLKVGDNVNGNCYVVAESTTGDLADDTAHDDAVHEGLCLPAGASDFTLRTGVSLAASFVGKVGSGGLVDPTEDSANPDDDSTPGSADFSAVTDWAAFENAYRAWGVDAGAFPAAEQRTIWSAGAGRIWDWSAATGDTGDAAGPALLAVVAPVPTGADVIEHAWSGPAVDQAACSVLFPGSLWVGTDDCRSTFLRGATELIGDGIGNDNAVCESAEACLYTPNLGSYQGHAVLLSTGPFVDGSVSGVTLLQHAANGY
jgi:parallel beta-helix repeat protein